MKGFVIAIIGALVAPSGVFAQVTGHVSVIVDVLPDLLPAEDHQTVTEARARLYAERHDAFGSHVRVNVAGYVDGLLANRHAIGGARTDSDATVHPSDVYVDIVTKRFEARAGAGRLVWGRLDELQPTDVVNPLDLSRFLLEGRNEARLAVGLVRGRFFLPHSTVVEGVVVPWFRRGRFDLLDEPTSPFNLGAGPTPTVRDEPSFGSDSLQGGVRVTSTTRRVDWGLSAYRGLKSFPIATAVAPSETPITGCVAGAVCVLETFPRFTMIGADFETVHGAWGVRGELAALVDDELQSARAIRGVPGHSVTAGIGVDRRAGDYRIAGDVLMSWTGVDEQDPGTRPFVGDDDVDRHDVSLVIAADRSFARETRTLRLFAVYDPIDATTFTRVIGSISLRDNVWLEGSAGLFAGTSVHTIGRLTRRDFVYGRLKVFF